MSDQTSDHAKLWDLIKDIKFGMFTHRHGDGRLHSHPLTTQNQSLDEGAVLYFFVSRSSEIAARVREDGNVNIAYAHPGKDSYVSVSGEARDVEDRATVERLWTKMAEAWFPGGPTDPDLQLLEVRIIGAEYWDVTDSKVTQLFKMAKSVVTGKPPQDLGEHKELRVS
ncbi:pyridoxamine 5'-phosphate oxidase family protein [uncultured Xylophilus sp.]|uniref:pyridoxamine 5'-phosphate oxidase family protein n=1 Tax=uncultured Xylophilus sp. TaxID=296832 RepID=UPI0025D5AFEF|nr:pyridoxamine 5'-phosphate oxidase family protein [uncultured Xylophilus sp.]